MPRSLGQVQLPTRVEESADRLEVGIVQGDPDLLGPGDGRYGHGNRRQKDDPGDGSRCHGEVLRAGISVIAPPVVTSNVRAIKDSLGGSG